MASAWQVAVTIYETGQKVKGLYDLAKSVYDFFAGEDEAQHRYERTLREIELSRSVILEAVSAVNSALADFLLIMRQESFLGDMASALTDKDRSEDALAAWKLLKDENQRSIALDASGEALNFLVNLHENGKYPEARPIAPIAIEVLGNRLFVLKEAFPDFIKASAIIDHINKSIALLRKAAKEHETFIEANNEIEQRRQDHFRIVVFPRSEGGGKVRELSHTTFTVRYQNLTGGFAFNDSVDFEPGEDFNNKMRAMVNQATAQRSFGIERDKQALGFYDLLNTASNFEKSILQHESACLEKKLFARSMTIHEVSTYLTLRKILPFKQSASALVTALRPEEIAAISPLTETESANFGKYAQGLLERELVPEEETTLRSTTEKFGPRSTLLTILSHPDSVFNDSDH